ncbi:hypothetical protein NQ317_004267 [Molorchus minor]|uniref:MULE transposase domain-containing protein n=1 Tax=Molorchus minor TaxID=1323400 RepID=A0ABQ9JZX2_9CUCU|nr:hypothetical protein NQ317_004267 [Molorchus minor]
MKFQNFSAFESWKTELEKKNNSKFINTSGSHKTGKTKFLYFGCHRSGEFISKGTKIRSLKIQGSNKIGGVCPASMSVKIENNSTVTISYIDTPVGHTNDLGHLTLTESERTAIARKIAAKIPFDTILDEVRESLTEDGKLNRLHLLTKMDLHNIENSFKLDINIKKHDNDAVSTDAWVYHLDKNDSCVLFYKPQNQTLEEHPALKESDFMLIIMNDAQKEMLKTYGTYALCIDSTHGLNQYNFELTTLLVLDDLHQGFPCAFLISNRVDEDALSIFFECIKITCGILKPEIFMSDMANAFFNAFIKVMTPPMYRLYCSWHVDRAWRKKFRKNRR